MKAKKRKPRLSLDKVTLANLQQEERHDVRAGGQASKFATECTCQSICTCFSDCTCESMCVSICPYVCTE